MESLNRRIAGSDNLGMSFREFAAKGNQLFKAFAEKLEGLVSTQNALT